MPINELVRNIKAARELLATTASLDVKPQVRTRMSQAERKLGAALVSINELKDDMFALQEQNQQLRRDLADHVCPRLCVQRRVCAT
jgi:phosphoglycerate-specific signal transduction histidine kinase